MTNLEHTEHARLIAIIRTLAELLDNCTDGLAFTVLATTVLLLLIIMLHAVADALETCPDLLTICTARLGRR